MKVRYRPRHNDWQARQEGVVCTAPTEWEVIELLREMLAIVAECLETP